MEDFNNWNNLKIKTNKRKSNIFYKDRDIWWCRIGKNIGNEIDGKSDEFTRPVLVLKKINRNLFIGLPLTHTLKEDKTNISFYFNYDIHCVNLAQIRNFDCKRLTVKIGRVSDLVYKKIICKLKNLL